MDGKQVFSMMMLILAGLLFLVLLNCTGGMLGIGSEATPTRTSQIEATRSTGEINAPPVVLGVYRPPAEDEPSLIENPIVLAGSAGLLVFGALGAAGWLFFGGSTPTAPKPAMTAKAGRGARPIQPEAAPGEPQFDQYGVPIGYVDPDGFDWVTPAKFAATAVFAVLVVMMLIVFGNPARIIALMSRLGY